MIPKLHSYAHPNGSPNTATLSDQNLKGERGEWVDNSISNQSPNKFYQANRFVK